MTHPEFELQKSVCKYLDLQYPDVLYLSDTIANLKLTIPQKVRNKSIQKADFHCPDLLILEPQKGFHGLFIELKVKDIYKKNSTELLKNEHVENQQKSINQLNKKDYKSCFCIGFEQAKTMIDIYMRY